MQFIDHSTAYVRKSISLTEAVQAGRAKLTASPEADKIAACFRPDAEIAAAFDKSIHARLRFDGLTTPEKLDLLIEELLPDFYHPELLPLTGRSQWIVRFLVDGEVSRPLMLDSRGIHAADTLDRTPDIDLETDAMTLLAILRSIIADYHLNKAELSPAALTVLSAEDAAAIRGGAPADDPRATFAEGDEHNEGDEGNEGNEGDEGIVQVDLEDDKLAADDGSCGGYACGADGGDLYGDDACGADACAIDASGMTAADDLDDVIGADLTAGLDLDDLDPGV